MRQSREQRGASLNRQSGPPSTLKRRLGTASAFAVVVGEVIAVGIFLAPAGMIRLLGSAWSVLVVWIGMGAMALSGALCFAEMAVRHPQAGGPYVYLRRAYGPAVAFLYGWMSLLIMDPGVTAALALGLSDYAAHVMVLSPLGQKVVAIGVIGAISLANILGAGLAAVAVRILGLLKISLVLLVILLGFARGAGDWSNFLSSDFAHTGGQPLMAALAGAVVIAFFAYGGWWDLSKLAGEVRSPGRTIPRALLSGVAVVTLLYLLTSAVFVYLVPPSAVSSDTAFAAQVGQRLFGDIGEQALAVVVIVSVVGSLAVLIMSAPRVYYAMGRDGVFLEQVGRVSPRFGTPVLAVVIQASLASIMVWWTTFAQLLPYFIFVAVIFVGLAAAALFVFRRREASKSEYQAWGYPYTLFIFLGLVLVMLILLFMENPARSLAGIAVTLAGWPVYLVSRFSRTGDRNHDMDTDDSFFRSERAP